MITLDGHPLTGQRMPLWLIQSLKYFLIRKTVPSATEALCSKSKVRVLYFVILCSFYWSVDYGLASKVCLTNRSSPAACKAIRGDAKTLILQIIYCSVTNIIITLLPNRIFRKLPQIFTGEHWIIIPAISAVFIHTNRYKEIKTRWSFLRTQRPQL